MEGYTVHMLPRYGVRVNKIYSYNEGAYPFQSVFIHQMTALGIWDVQVIFHWLVHPDGSQTVHWCHLACDETDHSSTAATYRQMVVGMNFQQAGDAPGDLGLISRLAPRNIDSSELSWDTWRLEDGTWTLELHYPNSSGIGIAQWSFDSILRTVTSMDENARWMMGDDPAPRQLPTAALIPTESSHPSERRIIDVYSEFR